MLILAALELLFANTDIEQGLDNARLSYYRECKRLCCQTALSSFWRLIPRSLSPLSCTCSIAGGFNLALDLQLNFLVEAKT